MFDRRKTAKKRIRLPIEYYLSLNGVSVRDFGGFERTKYSGFCEIFLLFFGVMWMIRKQV